jgi:hypothetical protein
MLAVGLADPTANYLGRVFPSGSSEITRIISAGVAFLVAYSFIRIGQVVQSDVSLIDIQAEVIRGAIARKNGKTFAENLAAAPAFKQPEEYGRRVQ